MAIDAGVLYPKKLVIIIIFLPFIAKLLYIIIILFLLFLFLHWNVKASINLKFSTIVLDEWTIVHVINGFFFFFFLSYRSSKMWEELQTEME